MFIVYSIVVVLPKRSGSRETREKNRMGDDLIELTKNKDTPKWKWIQAMIRKTIFIILWWNEIINFLPKIRIICSSLQKLLVFFKWISYSNWRRRRRKRIWRIVLLSLLCFALLFQFVLFLFFFFSQWNLVEVQLFDRKQRNILTFRPSYFK